MNYCPNCGVELSGGANFCPECGEQTGEATAVATERETERRTDVAQQNAQTATDRIRLETGVGAERVYNVGNISYFQNLNHEYTLLAKAGFATLALFAFGAGAAGDSWIVTGVGLTLIVTVWSVFSPDDGLVIGTLADTDEIETDDPGVVERDFLEKTSNQISLGGVISSPVYKLEYTYHFLKTNVISIERFGSINKLWPTVALVVGTGGLAVAYTLVGSEPTVADVKTAISIGVISHLVVLVGVGYLYYGIYANSLQSYFSKREASIYFAGGFLTVLSAPAWLLTRQELNELSITGAPLVASGAVQEVQLYSVFVMGLSVLFILVVLSLPPAGVRISLPSSEQLHFSMTDTDAKTIIEEFRQ